jgi:ABC-type nitrate/sulfonate/bicarbonate transport system substrate-binding protein
MDTGQDPPEIRRVLIQIGFKGKSMNKSWKLLLAAILAVLAVGPGCFLTKFKPAKSDLVEIRILGSTAPTEWEIANKLSGTDIFEKEHVKVKIIPGSAASGPRFQALLTGNLDVEGGAWIGWINIRGRGGKIKAVINGGLQTKDRKAGIMVLENSPIHSVKDLVGKTIAVNTLGLTAEYTIKEILRRNGLSLNQVQLVAVPTENQEQVLRTKQVDAAADVTCSATWIDMAFDRGGVRLLPETSNYSVRGENASTGTGFREDFIKDHPQQVKGFVAALEKTRRYVWDEFQKNPQVVRKAYAEIAEAKGGNPKLAKFYIPSEPDYNFNMDRDVQWWIDALVADGKVKPGVVKAADVYTDEFNPFISEKSQKGK